MLGAGLTVFRARGRDRTYSFVRSQRETGSASWPIEAAELWLAAARSGEVGPLGGTCIRTWPAWMDDDHLQPLALLRLDGRDYAVAAHGGRGGGSYVILALGRDEVLEVARAQIEGCC